MNTLNPSEKLKIRLTATPPQWAEAGVAALRQLSYIEVFEAAGSVDLATMDVVLHFGVYSETIHQQYGTGRLGFWFLRFGGQDIDAAAAAKRSAVTGVALEVGLWAKFADNRCACLYQSFGQLCRFSTSNAVIHALAKAAFFPERVLSRYRRNGELITCAAEPIVISSPSSFASSLNEISAKLRRAVRRFFYHEQWFIVADKGKEMLPKPDAAKWFLEPPADCFWADPFPLEKGGRVWILFEVLPFATERGHLAAAELFADGSYGEAQTVMMPESHLSYPFMFTWQDELYLLPEAGESRELAAWKCEQLPNRWVKAATLLSDVCFTDATLVEHENRWWLFLTLGEEGGICLHEELHLYYADSPLGPWTAHIDNPVKSDARSARPAGNIFYQGGALYRPAQDCTAGYGTAIVLNRIDRLDTEGFGETPVARIDPGWRKGCLCTHTLSRSENYWAVDGLRLLPRWAGFFKRK